MRVKSPFNITLIGVRHTFPLLPRKTSAYMTLNSISRDNLLVSAIARANAAGAVN